MAARKNSRKVSGTKNINASVNPSVGNYEKHPFFVKKTNEAKVLLKTVGFPEKTGNK